jgi:hypothetical protein
MAEWMKHSRESVIAAGPGPFPEKVNVPVTTRGRVAYIHFLPAFKDPAIWKNAPRPKKAVLLRTGVEVSFAFQDGALTIAPAESLRTNSVDVVKVEFE